MGSLFSLLLAGCLALAAEPAVREGVYSAATESGLGSHFELKAGGKAVVTPSTEEDHEDDDDSPGQIYPADIINGTWKPIPRGIEITYGKVTDQFILEAQCRQWPEYYCLRYKKTVRGGKSGLEFTDKAFVNWDWKYTGPKVIHKLTKKCVDECSRMKAAGELQQGIDIQACGEMICTDAE